MGEAWEPSEKQWSFGKQGAFTRRVLSFNFKTSAQTQPSKSYPNLQISSQCSPSHTNSALRPYCFPRLRNPAAWRRHSTVTLPRSLPNVLTCFSPIFTRRTNGHYLKICRAENLFSSLLSPVITVAAFAASPSASDSSLLHSGLVSDVTESTKDRTSTKC